MPVIPPPFAAPYPVIGVIHLPALPGAPGFAGDIDAVRAEARRTLEVYESEGLDGVIVENYHDAPFFATRVPPATVAAMAAIVGDVVTRTSLPVGVNVLRNDGPAAMAVAAAAGAAFVRINVLGRPVVSEQGVIAGEAAEVLRLRAQLAPSVGIWADAAVKHASPMTPVALDVEVHELTERCGADVIIISGQRTGLPTDPMTVKEARRATDRPVFIGSGATAATVGELSEATGFIVGTAFEAAPGAPVAAARVAAFMDAVRTLRASTERSDR